MDSLFQDVRYALRVLVKSPAFTIITLATIAVGTGANATVFSFVSALLLRPAPGVKDPGSLVSIYTSDFSSGPYGGSSYPDYVSLKSSTSAFRSMAAVQDDATGVIRAENIVERVRIASVSGEYFDLLGVAPSLGRLLTPSDTSANTESTAVIGHSLWRRAFGSDPTVIGSTMVVNGRSHTIVGITSDRFQGLELGRAMEVWTPLVPPAATPTERENRGLSIVGRLTPGVGLPVAQAQLSTVAARLAELYPETNLGTLGASGVPRPFTVVRHTRLPPQFRGDVTTLSAILMAAVALVLVIACANIASLMLARATARDQEMSIRLALGAGRQRIIRQLLTESILLGLAGGAVGLLFLLWTADILPSFFPPDQAAMLDTSIDAMAVALVVLLSLFSSILFGLAPALQSSMAASSATLKSGMGRSSDSHSRATLRRVLVSGQIAVAVVLLISAALLTQSILRTLAADPGYGARDAVLASVEMPSAEFTPAQGYAYYRAALERIGALPGVASASFAWTLPFGSMARRGFQIEGYDPRPGEDTELHINVVSDAYFATMQIPVLEGRSFDRHDRPGSQPVVIVNQLFADRYYGGKALGRRITDSHGTVMTIVGIVATGRYRTFQEPPVPVVVYPLAQSYMQRMTLVARTNGEPSKLMEPIRRELLAVNPNVPVFRMVTLSAHVSEAIADGKLTAALVAACGGMALMLSTLGVYGVIAYSVARRMREIGVRVALGARPRHVIHLVLTEGLGVTTIGILFGLLAAAVATRGLKSLLFGVSVSDPLTYVAVPGILAVVALLAACPSLRRALRIEPNVVLRQE